MCGIFGYIANGAVVTYGNGKNSGYYAAEDAFAQGLLTSIPRGKDATGIFTVPRFPQDQVQIYKRALNATDFFQLDRTKQLLRYMNDYRAMVGHVRAGTIGGNVDDNAHPHSYGNIVMVHNGTLTRYNEIVRGAPTFKTDSQALCYAINELGISEALSRAEGSFAVVVYNKATNEFQFARNKDRPLSFCYIEKPKMLIFASERAHLKWILERNGLEPVNNQFYSPQEDVIITVNNDNVHDVKGVKIPQQKKLIAHTGSKAQSNSSNSKSTAAAKAGKQRDTVASKILAELGYNLGDEVAFWAYEYEGYRNSDVGIVRGTLSEDGFDCIIGYSVNESLILNDQDEIHPHEFVGTICSAKYEKHGDQNIATLVLTGVAAKDGEVEDVTDESSEGIAYIADGNKNLITLEEFKAIAKHNCSSCGGKIFPTDVAGAGWLAKAFVSEGQSGLICPVCVNSLNADITDPQHVVSHNCVTN